MGSVPLGSPLKTNLISRLPVQVFKDDNQYSQTHMDIFDILENPLLCKPLQSLKFKTMKEAQNVIYIISWKTSVTCKAWRMKEQEEAQVWSHFMKESFTHWKNICYLFPGLFCQQSNLGTAHRCRTLHGESGGDFLLYSHNTRIVISFVVFTLFLGWESLFDLLLLLLCACQVLRHGGGTSPGDLMRWS